MARTIDQIYSSIEAAKNADVNLAGLTSTSNVAIYRLWMYVMAVAIHLHESLWDMFRKEIEDIRLAPGTPQWYQGQCLAWQYGHPLVFVDHFPGYAVDDPAARIITRAAITQQPDKLVQIKVAKATGTGLGPLSSVELAAFTGYIDRIKFAGTDTSIISLNPALLTIPLVVYFDPIRVPSEVLASIQDAVAAYLAALPFNGELVITALLDAVLHADGVMDLENLGIQVDDGLGYFTVADRYIPLAGYFQVDPANDLPLTLILTPYV